VAVPFKRFELVYKEKKLAEGCQFSDGMVAVEYIGWKEIKSYINMVEAVVTMLQMEDKQLAKRLINKGDPRIWRNGNFNETVYIRFKDGIE